MRWERCRPLPPLVNRQIFRLKREKQINGTKNENQNPRMRRGRLRFEMYIEGREPRLIGGFEVNLLVNMYS